MSGNVHRRRIAATPVRSAGETWSVITGLLAPDGSSARRELDAVAGVASSLIAAESPKESAIVVAGVGARLRIYCLFDEAAVVGEDLSEESLDWDPTDGDWMMSLPCHEEDLVWVQRALKRVSTRVTARDLRDVAQFQASEDDRVASGELGSIDVEAFLRP